LGGSQGSQRINDLMLAVAVEHGEVLDGWRVLHQTGAVDEERVRARYSSHNIAATVSAFFADPAGLYRQAAVAVARAGGTTLSELACAGLPAVLLPYPHAVDDHQWHNAEVFRTMGAAVVFREEPNTPTPASRFADALSQLLNDGNLHTRMSAAMSALARPHAADEVVKLLRCGAFGEAVDAAE
jgi:UDP-N-acetylglucosamine--N-acetylmuramyl-(pentapeptide) pyrophosphoryl-undecaprenol N-acetylglucosamine transferase